jgi:putative ABC transport system permease protein
MNALWELAIASLWNRRITVITAIASVALSVALLIGVLHLREDARTSFAGTVSGIDLIVGPRSGPLNLLLFTVFHSGTSQGLVSLDTYERVAHHPDVEFAIPMVLGDSHKGFPVLGTNANYFKQWHFGGDHALLFQEGGGLVGRNDAVIGSTVAEQLHYRLGDVLTLTHGLNAVEKTEHKNEPVTVVGILKPTGTPVDRTVHVPIEVLVSAHRALYSSNHFYGPLKSVDEISRETEKLDAFVVRMKERPLTFMMQRALNEYNTEPLTAIMPGVVLNELWGLVSMAEGVLLGVAIMVVVLGLLGLCIGLLGTVRERRREMAILRSLGASPRLVFSLLTLEAFMISALGSILGFIGLECLMWLSLDVAQQHYGLILQIGFPTFIDLGVILAVCLVGAGFAMIPALIAYRHSIQDGLTIYL